MTSTPKTKVAIVGAGAIGGLFAGWLGSRLPVGQIQLAALARGETLRALREQGLTLSDAAGTVQVPIQVSDDAAALGPQDLVVVAVKGPALATVAPAVRALMGPHTQVLLAMNGLPWWFFDGLPGECAGLALHSVDPEGVIAAAIPSNQVIGCVVHISSTAPAPGQVRHVMGNGLIIGEPAGGPSGRVASLAALLDGAGFRVTVSERIQRDIWFKLWGNMTMNPVSAITGATCDRILDDPLVRGFCNAVMSETQAIGARIGCKVDQSAEDRHAVTRKLGAFKTSMLQDVEAGRTLEIDALVGAVYEIGQHLGLATPNIGALLGLVRLMAQSRGLNPAS
ncbi:2-dehydropantoate 2-reductase [Polaromonas sp. OV174]|uniref:2-dehydropantoate 2-reductase n=1 Tax=Polaromonas sp. OV174 TaxID=1855300 RepID=UPI0008EFCE61|nr:2-dehydropantoate 2-reductase [Polaromonas sp. OV174]SFC58236.1 2-dehydropantoate 2-reductase [Polaromonas sp. OV174]